MEKLCTSCNKYLDESKFSLRKGGKTSNICYECESKRKREWYEQNKEKIKEQRKEYMKTWHEQHKEEEKSYREKHKERITKYSKDYYEQNKDKIKKYYTKKNAEKETKLRKRAWYDKHIKEKKEQDRIYYKFYKENKQKENRKISKEHYLKQKNNSMYIINNKISKYVSRICKENIAINNENLNFTFQQFREHFEKQFTSEMNWNNYGSYWEIDHIIPKNQFNFTSYIDKDFKICWSLLNLRPLTVSENRSRPRNGSDIAKDLKQKILGQNL